MKPTSHSAVWLCTWRRGRAPVYVTATTAPAARRQVMRRGLPSPDGVSFAGTSTSASASRSKATTKARARREEERIRPRARAALRLLAALRADWPVASILAARRHGKTTLLDFVGNMGLALGRLEPTTRRQVERLVELEARAAANRAAALNARRAGDVDAELEHRRRADDAAASARRLAKRQAVRRGLADLDATIAGELEAVSAAAVTFEATLRGFGYSPEEAARFTAAWRRILVPRF